MYKILSLGNALVDIITSLNEDEELTILQLPKGSMQLVDEQLSIAIDTATNTFPKRMTAGGSAANTIKGLAALGVSTGYIGSVGNDDLGRFFEEDLTKYKIRPHLISRTTNTGKAIAFITPDSERTFATYLGAAASLTADDLNDEMFQGYQLIHIEGYLMQNYDLVRKAITLSKKWGLKISFDLASYNVVEAHLDFLKEIMKGGIDIIFANEEEAKAYTQLNPLDAVHALAAECEIAIVKIGKDGSYVKTKDTFHQISVVSSNPIDTTGAGDLYAAGFLFGLSQNYSLDRCGKIGSILSGKVIEDFGAGIKADDWPEILHAINQIDC